MVNGDSLAKGLASDYARYVDPYLPHELSDTQQEAGTTLTHANDLICRKAIDEKRTRPCECSLFYRPR